MEQNKRNRGRPKRELADFLQAQVWFDAVRIVSKKKADALEIEFRELKRGERTSNLWNKYACGKVTPKNRLVDQVESVYQGTAECFYHPLWRLLHQKPLTYEEYKQSFFKLGPEARAILVYEKKEVQYFWRMQDYFGYAFKDLIETDDVMDILAGTLLLIQEALLQQDASRFLWVLDNQEKIWSKIESEWPFNKLFEFDRRKTILTVIQEILVKPWSEMLSQVRIWK